MARGARKSCDHRSLPDASLADAGPPMQVALPMHARVRTPRKGTVLVLALLTALGALSPTVLHAQSLTVGAPLEAYLRLLQDAGRIKMGSFTVRPFVEFAGIPDSVDHPWKGDLPPHAGAAKATSHGLYVTLDPAGVRLFANSGYPFGGNDGAVWQGKGLTTALDAGATLIWGHVSATLHPTFWYAQNAAFPMAPVTRAGATPYGYPWWVVDLPQRFGPGHVATVDPGQSTLRVTFGGATAGFGTENLWWGPGIHSAIIMSDNAAGFPHGFLATSRPVSIGIGTIEAQWIWGRLQQTKWFDSTSVFGQGRFITGAVGSFTPKGLQGLTLGATRVFTEMVPPGGISAGEYFLVFQRGLKQDFVTAANPQGQDRRDQILSIFARWVLPASGFESYAEWARNDHAWNLRDLLLEPEHSQAYVLGVQKTIDLTGNRIVAVNGELTHLERDRTYLLRADPVYYVHSTVLPGYTERGQIIGSMVGPGGDEQQGSVDLYAPWGRAGVFGFRLVHDNDAYYAQAQTEPLPDCCHDVTLGAGLRAAMFVHGVQLSGSLGLMRELNRYFVAYNDVSNVHLQVAARWWPGQHMQQPAERKSRAFK